jgi:hypothetical protein
LGLQLTPQLVPSHVAVPAVGTGHDRVQLPQVFGSVALTHFPWQAMKPLLHLMSHALFVQTGTALGSVVEHAWHVGPQWAMSVSAAHWALVPHW